MNMRFVVLGLTVFGMAGCGGTTGGRDVADFIVSNGVIDGIELPTQSELDTLPTEVASLINDFRDLNETGVVTANMPMGFATYSGDFGIGVDDGEGGNAALIAGDMMLNADFANLSLNGTVTNLAGQDGDGNPLTVSNDLTITSTITGSEFGGNVDGMVLLEGETYGVNGTVDGAFVGDAAANLVGTTDGFVTNPDNSTDSFNGLIVADKD